MTCPRCRKDTTAVYRTMQVYDGKARRRYRKCIECGYQFTTIEALYITPYDMRVRENDRH